MKLDQAVVFDLETIVNCFTCHVQPLFGDWEATFEISEWRDDRHLLLQWIEHWAANDTPMIGYNSLAFDNPIMTFLRNNPGATYHDLFEKAQEQIHDHTMFKTVRPSDCFAPQIDLMKVHHFDNRAKMTSLKALQVNMRSETVLEMPCPFDQPISREDIDRVLIPYNRWDVLQTKKFALISLDAIKFRIELSDILDGDVVNWSDSKIGSKILEQRLGDDLCYTRETGRREVRNTRRERIALADIIFPYIRFAHPELQRVLTWMRGQVISEDEVTGKLKTKGIFTDVSATVGGLDLHFGTGGIHGCVPSQVVRATSKRRTRDIDVAGMYPAIAIVNRLYPAHLGERFVFEYSQLPIERAKYKKKTPRNDAFKLAGNATIGNTNNEYSVFYDTAMNLSITLNGQLMLAMLCEWLLTVPTVRLLQANTDGVTYQIDDDHLARAQEVERAWQSYTRLVLEDVEYSTMWIGDVNNYIAESVDGKFKLKGRFWFPRVFPDDITNASPPAWHKDLSNIVSTMAAVEFMTKGTPIERFIYDCADPFLFMIRAKCDRASQLWIGDKQTQRIIRYFVAREGGPLRKVSPPAGPAGEFKRRSGISDWEYHSIKQTIAPWQHDERVHTKNRSKYETRETGIQSGFLVADCSRASDFNWNALDYSFYVREAEKLVIK